MVNMANSLDEPLVVELYFPAVNEVKEEVRGYFDELASETGNVQVRVVDRVLEAKLAQDHRVQKDGTIVLVKGERFRAITINTKIKQARGKSARPGTPKVQKAFMKVATDARTAYLLIGHGELNDPLTKKNAGRNAFFKTRKFQDVLKFLNYRVKNLGAAQGLEQRVPDDCTLLIAMGPTAALSEAELSSIDPLPCGRRSHAVCPRARQRGHPRPARGAPGRHVRTDDGSRTTRTSPSSDARSLTTRTW